MNTVRFNHPLRIAAVLLLFAFLPFLLPHQVSAMSQQVPFQTYSLNSIYFYKGCDRINRTVSINTTATASGSTADEKIWSALKSLGITDEVAAGILGNIHNEGGASPVRYENEYKEHWADGSFDWENDPAKGHGVGIVQWSGARRVNLFKHLRSNGASNLVDKYLKHPETYGAMSGDQFIQAVDDPADADTLYALEVDFIVYEIKNSDEYAGVLEQTTVKDAAEYFSMHFEKCRECITAGSAENQERIDAAEAIYQQFTGKSSFGGSSSGRSICDCDDGGNLAGGGSYAGGKYSFTDEELKRLWWAATAEEGEAGEEGIKTELSIFANIFERYYGKAGDNEGLIREVTKRYHNGNTSGWFAKTTGEAYETGGVSAWNDHYPTPSDSQIAIAKDILNNGHRTIPPQIVEHDGLGDIVWVQNNGSSFDKHDRSQYKSGVTVIHFRATYVFYQWANGEKVCSSNNCGDPFGYFENDPPAQSTLTNTETGSITWTNDGWIEGGIDGYKKEDGSKFKNLSDTANQDFTTDMPNTKGKGPNKITIITTESPNGSGKGGLELFKTRKKKPSHPPHFTINLLDKKVYQHFPLYKTSGANTSTNDGIYIAIIGYTDADKAKQNKDDKWIISEFTESDLNYLTELVRGINATIGTEPSAITAPSEITTHLTKSLATPTTSECSGSSATGNIIADTAIKLSWDCGSSKNCHSSNDPKPEYVEAMKEVNIYDDPGGWGYGASCDRFVAVVMRYTKADENFPTGYANDSGGYLEDHPELYEEIHFDGSNYDILQPGDIFSTFSPRGNSGGHIWIYVTINGEHGRADASNGENSGRTAEHYTSTPKINDGRQYKVFRKK